MLNALWGIIEALHAKAPVQRGLGALQDASEINGRRCKHRVTGDFHLGRVVRVSPLGDRYPPQVCLHGADYLVRQR